MDKIDYIEKFIKTDLNKCNFKLGMHGDDIESDIIRFKRDLTLNIIDSEFTICDKGCLEYDTIIFFRFDVLPIQNPLLYEGVSFRYDKESKLFSSFLVVDLQRPVYMIHDGK